MHKNLPKRFVFLDKFETQLLNYNKPNLGVIYRNYNNKVIKKDLEKIVYLCKKKRFKLYVANNLKLAQKVKAFGVYIPSFNKIGLRHELINKKNIHVIGSAHNQREICQKIDQRCKIIFISPLFNVTKKTEYKRNSLGIIKFNLLTLKNNFTFYALGGIKTQNLKKLKIVNAKGFAGISWFKKKPV